MSLTSHLDNKKSPVRQFLRGMFPNAREFLADARKLVRQADTIRPEEDVPWDTIGTAVDYRVRYYFGVTPSEKLVAYEGARRLCELTSRAPVSKNLTYTRAADRITFFDRVTGKRAGVFLPDRDGLVGFGRAPEERMSEMHSVAQKILDQEADSPLDGLAGLARAFERFFEGLDDLLQCIGPAGVRLGVADEDALNRYCLVLAELEKIVRAGYRPSTLLDRLLDGEARPLVDLVDPHWTEDLRKLSWEFYMRCSHLLTLPATLNPTFDGSRDVGGADADLIVDGTLFEIKTTVKPEIGADWIWQLMGYVLLDYRDALQITDIGIYMVRQGLLFRWDLEEAVQVLSGQTAPSIEELRACFRETARGRHSCSEPTLP